MRTRIITIASLVALYIMGAAGVYTNRADTLCEPRMVYTEFIDYSVWRVHTRQQRDCRDRSIVKGVLWPLYGMIKVGVEIARSVQPPDLTDKTGYVPPLVRGERPQHRSGGE